MTKKVFISYQRQQEAQIKELADSLTQTGNFEVWFDKKLKVGENWWDEILNHIETAEVIILALSPTYLTSEACNREWRYARDWNKVMIPLQVEQTLKIPSVHEDIRRLQITPYYGTAAQFLKLQADMDAAKAKPPPAQPPARPPAPMDAPKKTQSLPKPAIMVGVLVVIALVIIAGVLVSQRNNSASATPTSSPASVSAAGAFDMTLIFGGQDSLTLKVNNDSHLSGLTLETPSDTETLVNDFKTLASSNFVTAKGTCLRFIREGASASLPLGCSAANALSVSLPESGIFWYSGGAYQTLTLKQSGMMIGQPCDPANGFGRCDFKMVS